MQTSRELTKAEREQFLKENQHGILAFAGGSPYAIPMGYAYKKGEVLLGVTMQPGRKHECLTASRQVCFTVCRPRWVTPNKKHPCTTVIIEGKLEPVADCTIYGLPAEHMKKLEKGRVNLHVVVAKRVGARQCTRTPCELFVKPAKAEKAG